MKHLNNMQKNNIQKAKNCRTRKRYQGIKRQRKNRTDFKALRNKKTLEKKLKIYLL